jgi:hypothetical protein
MAHISRGKVPSQEVNLDCEMKYHIQVSNRYAALDDLHVE